MTQTLTHFIGGEQIHADAATESSNPSDTGDIVAHIPSRHGGGCGRGQVAARKAFPAWSQGSPEVRSDLLDKVGDLILQRREALGNLLAREEGKTLPEAIGEVARAGPIFK